MCVRVYIVFKGHVCAYFNARFKVLSFSPFSYELFVTSKFCHCFVVVLLFCHSFAKEDFNAFKHLNTQGCEVFLGFHFVFTSYILHSIKVRISKFFVTSKFYF